MTEEAKVEDNFNDINITVKNILEAFKTKNSSGEIYLEEIWTKRESLNFNSPMLADFLFHHLSVSNWSVEKPFWKDVIVMANEPKIKITRDLAIYDVVIDSSRCFQEVALSLEKQFVLGFFGVVLQNKQSPNILEKENYKISESINMFSNKVGDLLKNSAENEVELDVKRSPFPVNFSSSSSMGNNFKISFYDINLYNADLDFFDKIIKTTKTHGEYVAGIEPAITINELENIVKKAISFTNSHFVKTYDNLSKNLIFVTDNEINKIAKTANRSMNIALLDTYIKERHLNKFVNNITVADVPSSEQNLGNTFKL